MKENRKIDYEKTERGNNGLAEKVIKPGQRNKRDKKNGVRR